MTEADLDRRYFGSSPGVSYKPNSFNIRKLAPPPADPVKRIPVSHQIGIQPQTKHPRIGRQGRSHSARTPQKPRRFPRTPENCSHSDWSRNGKGSEKGQKLRCKGCGTCRRMDSVTAEKVMRGEIPAPPKRTTGGRTIKPLVCGSHRMYKTGCRCGPCVAVKRGSNNAAYARKVLRLAQDARLRGAASMGPGVGAAGSIQERACDR